MPKQCDWYVQSGRAAPTYFDFQIERMADCFIIATGVDNRVSSCGNGHFCCYVNNSTECCSTSSDGFSLGVATIVTTIAVSNSTPTTTTSKTSATSGPASTPAVTSQSTSSSDTNAPATRGSDRDVAVGVGAGVVIPVGLAILAGCFFYLMRYRSRTRSEGLLEMHAVAKDRKNSRLRGPLAERWLDELPAENPGESPDPHGPRAELEIRGHRAEIG